ncbi:MAG TPA: CHAP domain-containing protein [Candidatus Limnocylindrales bacterium]|nr:CHAP domain-containing protein [Candidatus Limnocylindrales bacterium]
MPKNQLGHSTGGSLLAKSRFFTHAIVLIVAAIVPLFTAFNRIHTDTAYGAGDLGPTLGDVHPISAANDVVVNQAGYIVKMDASTADVAPRRDLVHYTMKAGDTVQNVAGQFGLTVDTVRWANNLIDVTAVGPGSILLIPPVNGVLVKVAAGMQLQGLATQYHVDPQAIIDFNFIRDPGKLAAGSMLMLPDGLGPSLDGPVSKPVHWSRLQSGQSTQSITYYGSVGGVGGRFPYGYCTWWVAHKRNVPWNGNAWQWWYNARLFGFPEGQAPRVGAIMVQGISWSSPVGHVAYVESVNPDGSFTVSEMNYGRWGVVDYRTIKGTAGQDILGFIY